MRLKVNYETKNERDKKKKGKDDEFTRQKVIFII